MGKYKKDPTIAFRMLRRHAPYEPGALVDQHIGARSAYERLRDGSGTTDDFDYVAKLIDTAVVRFGEVAPNVIETHLIPAQHAMLRMKERYLRGLRLGFDAAGLRDVPIALDAWESIADASTPGELGKAIREVYRRQQAGVLVTLPAVSSIG